MKDIYSFSDVNNIKLLLVSKSLLKENSQRSAFLGLILTKKFNVCKLLGLIH